MNWEQLRQRSVILVVLALALSGLAQAALLPPATTLAPVPGEPDPTAFSAVTAPLVGFFNAPGSFTGAVLSRVYQGDVSNPFGGLTFSYEIQNNAASIQALGRMTLSGFAGFAVDASFQTPAAPGAAIPALVDRDAAGNVVGFSFAPVTGGTGPIAPGQTSVLLVLQTNAPNFQSSTASVIDGGVATALVYVPIPEPSMLGLVGLAAVGLLRRR